MKPDVFYGRIIMHIPKNKTRKMANGIPAISWSLASFPPAYVRSCKHYLSYSVNGEYHKLYNPDKFRFDLDSLLARLVEFHLLHDKWQVKDFRIIPLTI